MRGFLIVWSGRWHKALLLAVLAGLGCSGNVDIDLSPDEISPPVSFTVKTESEVVAHLYFSSDTDWGRSGDESAVVTLYLDKDYTERNQDIVLFKGPERFVYKVALGRLAPGPHVLELKFDRAKSSAGASRVHLEDMEIREIPVSRPDSDVYRFSPILYGRNDNYYTDTPLLMYHEVHREERTTTIDYTIIWSNEDGGTDTKSLMSRWGRTTDIELTYRVKLDDAGKVLASYYHGAKHDTLSFQGKWLDEHPIVRTATLNNQVSDSGWSKYKFFLSPELGKKKGHAREIVMDENPWTYEVMAKEMKREGKYENAPNPASAEVSDARNYLYLEFNSTVDAAETKKLRLTFGVQLDNDSLWYYSDHQDTTVKAVNRGGWRRTTIELPRGTAPEAVRRLRIRGWNEGSFRIRLLRISKVFMLDEKYVPVELPYTFAGEIVLDAAHPDTTLSLNRGVP